MKDDLIRRQTAITAIQKAYADTEGGADRCAVWKNVGLTNALHIMQDLPSAQPEHLVKESGNLVNGLVNDCISRQAAIDALSQYPFEKVVNCISIIEELPSAQPRWTPVAEALPRDDEDVIVTCLDDSGDTPFSYTTVAWHYKGMWVCDNMRCPFVIAWMPRPKPWKGEKHEL